MAPTLPELHNDIVLRPLETRSISFADASSSSYADTMYRFHTNTLPALVQPAYSDTGMWSYDYPAPAISDIGVYTQTIKVCGRANETICDEHTINVVISQAPTWSGSTQFKYMPNFNNTNIDIMSYISDPDDDIVNVSTIQHNIYLYI